MPSNINQFDLYTAYIFARLYSSFPVRIKIDFADVIKQVDFKDDHVAEGEDQFERNIEVARHTAEWLISEGYISGKSVIHKTANPTVPFSGDVSISTVVTFQGLENSTLTSKGFHVLRATPSSLDHPLGDKITDAVENVGVEASKAAIGELIGLAIKGVLPNIG